MKKRLLILIVGLILLFSACTKKSDVSENPIEDNPSIESTEWVFDVSPTHSDSAGIDADSSFMISSIEEVSVEMLNLALEITPEIEYEIIENTRQEFLVVPTKKLVENQIYKINISSTESNLDYSWAFQTKKKLQIVSTLPGNLSNYVPINSGIEIMFNNKGIENFEDVFEIEPKVDGRFTDNGYSMIFIPDELERGTTYTVTIKGDASVKESDLTLGEDYKFSFKTEPFGDEMILSLNNVLFNYTTSQNHFVSGYTRRNALDYDYDVNIYAFNSSDDFLSDIKAYDEQVSFEKLYAETPDYLQLIKTFNTKPVMVEYGYSSFSSFEFPEPLDAGYYLIKISYENKDFYCYVQVNDMLVYNSQFEEEHFFWIVDSKNNIGIKNAEIVVDDTFKGESGSDGTARISYDYDEEQFTTYSTIEAKGYNDFVMRSARMFFPYMMENNSEYIFPNHNDTSKDYWKYLFTDRSTYLPTDKMNLYGYINPKIDSTGKYKISLYSNINGFSLVESKNIATTKIGTFTDSFEWEEMSSGWYSLLIEENDTLIMQHQFYINQYTKPVYKVEGEFNREFISSGESIQYDLKAGFFDGTPVPGMAFNYYMWLGDQIEGKTETDTNGNASFTLTPSYQTTSWRPVNSQLEVYNTKAEDFRISAHDYFTFLPKDKMIEIEYNDEKNIPEITILAHELDSEKYDTSFDFKYEDLRGQALNTSLQIKITESWFDKIEKGQVYDYINKVNKKNYEYVRRTKVIEEKDIEVVDGEYSFEMPYIVDSENRFLIEVTLDEGNGEKIIETYNVNYEIYPHNPMFADTYSIRLKNDERFYRLEDAVDFKLDNQGKSEEIPSDLLLIMYLKDGLKEYEILDSLEGSFTFEEEDVPNILLQGIYYKEGNLIKTMYPTNVYYDHSEREIEIEIESDKTDYGPGDNLELSFLTKDAAGNPYPTDLNISIVDEAYFNLYSQNADMLGYVYAPIYSTGIISEYVSSDSVLNNGMLGFGAEGGGPESDYYVRSEFKDTSTFMTYTTASDGKGFLRLSLPDNLTSWRITYQGINDKMEASTGWFNINAKLPFHISTILSKYFITGDKPSISLRIFGEEASPGERVEFKLILQKEGDEVAKEIKRYGLVGEYTNISLGELGKGNYTLTIYAQGQSYNDALIEKFEVVDSTVYFNNKEYYSIDKRTDFDTVYSNALITFFNENESNFYNSLLDLRYSDGKRIDQIIAGMEARKFIKAHFEPKMNLLESSINGYQNFDGGIKLLPYSESDPLLSARITLLESDYFNKEMLLNYFNSIIYNQESDSHSVVAAFTGLAALGEPVLIEINQMLNESDFTLMEKVLLALALEAIGDERGALTVYNLILEDSDSSNIVFSEDDGENYLAKGLLSTLAVKLGDDVTGDMLFDDLYENPSFKEIAHLERIEYLKNRDIMDSEEIKALSGSVTIQYLEKEETIELFGFNSESITLTPEEVESLAIKDVAGNMGAFVYALGNIVDMKENQTDEFEIEREYLLKGKKANEFIQSDLIEVVLTPKFNQEHEGSYQITDFIPAGFRFVKVEKNGFWYEIEEQKIIFYYWDAVNHPDIRYSIQAVMPGEYTADYAVMIKNGEIGTNFTNQEELVVK